MIAGINIGSVTAKTVIMDESRKILSHSIVEEGIVNDASAKLSLTRALDLAGLGREEIRLIVTTGYGRKLAGFGNKSVTEITCHATGAHFLLPEMACGSGVASSIVNPQAEVSSIRCGLARSRSLVGGKPTQVAVSHGPGIQPCRCTGNRMLDA